MSDIDAEKLIENIEKYGSAEGDPQAQTPSSEGATSPDAGFRFNTMDDLLKHQLEYKVGDRPIKEDLATILQRAGMGYNYAQSIHKFKTEQQAWESERQKQLQEFQQKSQQAQALNDKWARFEEYAQKNPEWYEHWNRAWDQRTSLQNGQAFDQSSNPAGSNSVDMTSQLNAMLEAKLQEKLAPLKEWESQQQQALARQKIAEEDKQLDDAIKATMAKYPEVDFSRTDPESGKSLEWQVMEFMQKSGMSDFNAAFKAFYHDSLVKLEVEKQLQKDQKQTQNLRKQGIVDIKDAPTQRKTPNTRGMSYEELTQLAARELGIG